MLRHRTKHAVKGDGRLWGGHGSREALASGLKGKRIVVVAEGRYLKNETTIFLNMVQRLGASGKSRAISYRELFKDPGSVEADILILRPTKFETLLAGEIIRSLAGFRESNPGSAAIVCVVGVCAFLELSKAGAAHAVVERNLDYPFLLAKGAEVLGKLQDSQ